MRPHLVGDQAARAAAATLMEGFPGVVGLQVVEGGVEATVDESFVDHELVAHLVRGGAKVRSLSASGQSLDDVFFRLAGKTSP